MGYVDLHLHTTASDGVLSPSELVRYAKAKGLQAVAITDHDRSKGVRRACQKERDGVEVIPGIELALSIHRLHAYPRFFSRYPSSFSHERLKYLQRARAERIRRWLKN